MAYKVMIKTESIFSVDTEEKAVEEAKLNIEDKDLITSITVKYVKDKEE